MVLGVGWANKVVDTGSGAVVAEEGRASRSEGVVGGEVVVEELVVDMLAGDGLVGSVLGPDALVEVHVVVA